MIKIIAFTLIALFAIYFIGQIIITIIAALLFKKTGGTINDILDRDFGQKK